MTDVDWSGKLTLFLYMITPIISQPCYTTAAATLRSTNVSTSSMNRGA